MHILKPISPVPLNAVFPWIESIRSGTGFAGVWGNQIHFSPFSTKSYAIVTAPFFFDRYLIKKYSLIFVSFSRFTLHSYPKLSLSCVFFSLHFCAI